MRDFEILIIDDASQDSTEETVRAYAERDSRIRYIRNDSNLGIARSRNKGVSLAQGEFVAMLDSDDYWIDARKLDRQMEKMREDKRLGLIGTAVYLVGGRGEHIGADIYEASDAGIRDWMLIKNQFAQSSVLMRKEAIADAGGYDERLAVCEDLALWLAIGKRWKLANRIEAMTAYRIHPGGISKRRKMEIAKTTDFLITRHKKDYPCYFLAKIKSIARIIKALI
jgi:glycosyltransferase involved in cell wall biosynthesis